MSCGACVCQAYDMYCDDCGRRRRRDRGGEGDRDGEGGDSEEEGEGEESEEDEGEESEEESEGGDSEVPASAPRHPRAQGPLFSSPQEKRTSRLIAPRQQWRRT